MLLQAQRKLREAHHAEASSLLDEVYALLPFRMRALPSAKSISEKLDLCQVTQKIHITLPNSDRRITQYTFMLTHASKIPATLWTTRLLMDLHLKRK